MSSNIKDLIERLENAKHFSVYKAANKLSGVDSAVASVIVHAGKDDGDVRDDQVSVTKKKWSAATLKPSQTSMVLDKAIGMALFMIKSGKIGGDLGAIVSSDNHIMDGHHRWAATILASGSKGKVGGLSAELPGEKLVRVLNILTKGQFNVRNGKSGEGSLAKFTSKNVETRLRYFLKNGIKGGFPWTSDDVKDALERLGDVEKAIKTIASNAGLIEKSVPGWAPDRKNMPVIEPENSNTAKSKLNNGEIDWNSPYAN